MYMGVLFHQNFYLLIKSYVLGRNIQRDRQTLKTKCSVVYMSKGIGKSSNHLFVTLSSSHTCFLLIVSLRVTCYG